MLSRSLALSLSRSLAAQEERKAKEEAEQKARQEAELKYKQEAAERKVREEAAELRRQEQAAERKAKIAESRGDDEDVPIAIRHFTGEVGSSSSFNGTTKRSGGNVPYEEMLPAHQHFNPPKDQSKVGDEAKTENLPIAIQRFTMAAYEEKQRMKAGGSAGEEGPSVAHLHFTPGLSLKQIVTAE